MYIVKIAIKIQNVMEDMMNGMVFSKEMFYFTFMEGVFSVFCQSQIKLKL